MNYYNEFDPKAAAWLRELVKQGLIPDGHIDERSITEVRADELRGYAQCHFFAGIGGWSLALQLAGWPSDRKVWTGSCPCQPYSVAGKGQGDDDPRNLWPHFRRLIDNGEPAVVFGEQVASKAGWTWFHKVRSDLEASNYAVGAAGLCGYANGSPHQRDRIYWTAYSTMYGPKRIQQCPETQIQKDRTFEALASRNTSSDSFENWKELLAETRIDMLDDGIPSTLVVRPACIGFGNAIMPELASEFIQACEEAISDLI